jgi:hypothetical protein
MMRLRFDLEPDPNLDADVEALLLDELRRRLKAALGMMYCTRHGDFPTITARGRVGTRFDFHVTGCCHEFVRQVKWRIDEL